MMPNESLSPAALEPVFRLKGKMFAVTVMELVRIDLLRLERQLAEKVAQAPNFFSDVPLLLSLETLGDDCGPVDLQAVLEICRHHGLLPLGIRARRESDLAAARALGLPILPPGSGRERHLPLELPSAEAAEEAPPAEAPVTEVEADAPAPTDDVPTLTPIPAPTLMITAPVRGGQCVYAPQGDLVVVSSVSAGAELKADGNVHVYGPLRGRVMAGVSGNLQARIFCQALTAELVAIGGVYKTAEDLRRHPQWGKPVQISLSGDVLNITRL